MSICLIDTSIFVEILRVPGMCSEHKKLMATLREFIDKEYSLLLPMATILETGNHIAQNGDGRQRRQCAERFVTQVRAAFSGDAPWKPTSFPSIGDMDLWLNEFPDKAMASKSLKKSEGTSLGDLTITKEWEKVCRQNPLRGVFIWSRDLDLQGYHQKN